MSERLSPDRRSFKQFLSFLFQQIQMPGLRGSVDHRIDLQWLSGLTQIRQEVKSGRFDPNTLINRLTRLIRGVVRADGTGWTVINTGAVPALFSDGRGVVLEGRYGADGVFHSDTLLVKHNGVYTPPAPGVTPSSADLSGGG